jgi:hypothetical protein
MDGKVSGEKEIRLGGKTYTLKMTFLGISESENITKCGLSALLQRLNLKISGIQDVTALIYGGLVGYNQSKSDLPFSYEELGEQILKDGLINFLPIAADLAIFGLTGKWGEELNLEKKKFESTTPHLGSGRTN